MATLAAGFGPLPAMTIDKIGYGDAGTSAAICPSRPISLRPSWSARPAMRPLSSNAAPTSDAIWVLETNLDDISGEVIGHCIGQLWEAGPLDVYTTAIQMKKNRPGVKLTVLCRAETIAALEAIVFRETGTLGIRRWSTARHVLPREMRQVATAWGPVDGKLGQLDDGSLHFAPEYESCRRIAAERQVPLREVYAAAQQAFDRLK